MTTFRTFKIPLAVVGFKLEPQRFLKELTLLVKANERTPLV